MILYTIGLLQSIIALAVLNFTEYNESYFYYYVVMAFIGVFFMFLGNKVIGMYDE